MSDANYMAVVGPPIPRCECTVNAKTADDDQQDRIGRQCARASVRMLPGATGKPSVPACGPCADWHDLVLGDLMRTLEGRR